MFDLNLPMTGFEPWIYEVGSGLLPTEPQLLSTLKLVYDIGSCLVPSKLIGIFSARIKSEIHVNHPTCTPNTFCSSSPTYKLQIYYFLSEPSNT